MEKTPLAPYLCVPNSADAIDFYKKAFGAKEVARHFTPDGSKIMHAQVEINGAIVMMSDDFPEYKDGKSSTPSAFGGTPVTIHLNVADVDSLYNQAVGAGAKIVMPLDDMFWGERYAIIEDPFGHAWSMSTQTKTLTPDEVEAAARDAFA